MAKGKLLAIDYGARHIGLAVSDSDRQMAFGRGTLLNKNIQQVFEDLYRMASVEQVSLILLGLPMGADGSDTPQTLKIRAFAEDFGNYLKEKGLNIEIEFIDESFSSFEANQMLQGLGVAGRDRKKTEDELAAVVLIHRYIDFRP